LERHAGVVSVQTLRAELLLALAGVGHEARSPQARVPCTRLAQPIKILLCELPQEFPDSNLETGLNVEEMPAMKVPTQSKKR
jgi:hypothetical protein